MKFEDNEPFSALAFKVANDPFVGSLTFIRIYSGKLQAGTSVYNSSKEKSERAATEGNQNTKSSTEVLLGGRKKRTRRRRPKKRTKRAKKAKKAKRTKKNKRRTRRKR